jgi:mannosyl-3-phosphoglycerate phosphatase
MKKYLVFTDLDGTLLDHENYSYEPALPALERLNQLSIPVIINSSKTAAEIKALRTELHNNAPFIVENGAAVCVPHKYFDDSAKTSSRLDIHSFGPDYSELLKILAKLRTEAGYKFRGFADMSLTELAERTGLSREQAELAKQRYGSEPLLWEDTEEALQSLTDELSHYKLTKVRGGRFVHVMGEIDKAKAMNWLLKRYRQAWPETCWCCIALGDSPNDRQMLESADIAVVIPAHQGAPMLIEKSGQVLRPSQKGPQGWRDAIEKILNF